MSAAAFPFLALSCKELRDSSGADGLERWIRERGDGLWSDMNGDGFV